MEKKKFIFYFLNIDDVHFTKDIIIIPYVMKKYFNFDVEIITVHEPKTYARNAKYTDNLKITQLGEDFGDKLAQTDVLMICGFYDWNINTIKLYKQVNPKGKIFLKLDLNRHWFANLDGNRAFIDNFRPCDLITVETGRLQRQMKYAWDLDTHLSPNGYYDFPKITETYEKENVILQVGRLDCPNKNADLLIKAFAEIHEKIPDWKLRFVGDYGDYFTSNLHQQLEKYPSLANRIEVLGLMDYEDAQREMKKAKILCLTSKVEASANVISEGLGNGCFIIASDVDGAEDVLYEKKLGEIYPINDLDALKLRLVKVCNHTMFEETLYEKAKSHAQGDLSWVKLCQVILEKLEHEEKS